MARSDSGRERGGVASGSPAGPTRGQRPGVINQNHITLTTGPWSSEEPLARHRSTPSCLRPCNVPCPRPRALPLSRQLHWCQDDRPTTSGRLKR